MSFGTIYTHKPNPRSTAFLAIAKAQGLKLDIVYAEKDNAENHAKLLELNPLGQVPVFVGADGYVLTECIPIALYITSQSDTTTLLGSCRRDYFSIIRWMSFANSDLLPAIGGVILPLLGRHLTIRKNSEDCLRAFHTDCRLLENQLRKTKYLVGEQPTLADFFTVGTLVFAVMVFHKVLKAEYPRLMEWFGEIYEVPMFKDVAGDLHLLDVPFPTLPVGDAEGAKEVKTVENGVAGIDEKNCVIHSSEVVENGVADRDEKNSVIHSIEVVKNGVGCIEKKNSEIQSREVVEFTPLCTLDSFLAV